VTSVRTPSWWHISLITVVLPAPIGASISQINFFSQAAMIDDAADGNSAKPYVKAFALISTCYYF